MAHYLLRRKCVAVGCDTCFSQDTPHIKLFRFPRGKNCRERYSKWREVAQIEIEGDVMTRYFLCALHFAANQFFDKERNFLIRNAVPTVVVGTEEYHNNKLYLDTAAHKGERFEQVKKIVETSKTTNLKSKQVTSTAAPRAMGQRNSSGRLVSAPDVSSSVNASSSLIDPLVLPGSSRSVSILPTRIKTESSSVSLFNDPHEVPEIDVEEEIEEFSGESREICEEQTHIVSDLHTENLKEVLLRLKAEKLVVELEKLKMDRKKLEAEKRNIALRTKVLELRKKMASLESDEDESRPLTSLPRAEKNPEPRSEDCSPLPNKSIFLHTPLTVQKDPHSDINTMAKRVSSPLVKSATSGRSERKKIQSQLRKPILRETSVELCQVRRKSSDTVTKDDDILSKSPAESIDVPGNSKSPLHLHGTIDIEEELSSDSFDSSNSGILEYLLKVKQTEPEFSSLEGGKHFHEHREEDSDSSSIHDSDVSVSGSMHVGSSIADDFAGSLAKRMKYADGPS